MSFQTTLTVSVVLVGAGDSINNSQQDITQNGPPPSAAQLQVGNNTIVVPSGFTVTKCFLKAPQGSSNSKTVKGASGDTGVGPWVGGPLVVPCASGGTFIINSGQIEEIECIWCGGT